MYAANPYQQYKEQSLATLSPGEVLVKLYDELIKQMRISLIGIEKKDYAQVNNSLNKAQTIIGTLDSSLDMKYEVSKGLRDLYIFFSKQLMEGNLKKNPAAIEQCIPLIRNLRDSFEQADKSSRKLHATAGGQFV